MRLAVLVVLSQLLVVNAWALTVDTALNRPVIEYVEKADVAYDKRKYRKAKKYYYSTARMGSKYSQYKLSVMYAKGEGVRKDLLEAYAWAAVAAEFDQEDLLRHKDDIWKQMTASQRREAQKMANKRLAKMNDLAITKMLMHQSRLRLTFERIGYGLLPESFVSINAPCDNPAITSDGAAGAFRAVSAANVASSQTYGGPCAGVRGPHDNPAVRAELLRMIHYTMKQRLEGERVELGEFEVLEEE